MAKQTKPKTTTSKKETPKPKGTKQIKDATLEAKKTERKEKLEDILTMHDKKEEAPSKTTVEDLGEVNAPPLEISQEEINEIVVKKEKEENEVLKSIKAGNIHHNNEENVWRLISKTENKLLQWENVVTAMDIKRGVLVLVKEAIANNITSTMTFVNGGKLVKIGDKWHLR